MDAAGLGDKLVCLDRGDVYEFSVGEVEGEEGKGEGRGGGGGKREGKDVGEGKGREGVSECVSE